MDTLTSQVTTRVLRSKLSDVLSRVQYAGERIGATRNGKLAAVIVNIADAEKLEALDMAQDVPAYREAQQSDDGHRISLAELRQELCS